ncbi:Hemagglutinin repeat protein [compost metagenome]
MTALALSGDIVNERSVTTHESADDERYQHREDLADSAARIEASGDLSLAAGRDLRNLGGALRAGGDAELGAGRHLLIAAAGEHDLRQRKGAKSRSRVESIVQHGSEVQVGGDLTASAGGDLAVVASTVKAGGDVALVAQGNVTLAAAANESHSEHHRKGGDKKVDRVDSTVRQQAAVVEAGRDVAIHAGDDLAVVGSQVRAQNDITLAAERDVNILAGKDESASYYFKSEKGSFGRSKSEQKESYDSTNVASVIEAGRDLTVNISQTAEGGLSLDGGRDVTVIGSQLKAGNDLLVGATGDVAVLSGVEEHGAYSKKTKSGFLGLSKSGKSQLKTTATQVASELGAGNDVVVAAGNDVRLRASTATAGNDVELRAGLIDKDGDINLVSANDTAYSLTEEYKKKVGMSVSDGFISVASAKKAGKEAQSSTSVGSQVSADRDATLQAERDINVLGSSISAGRNVSLDAGRDVNVLAAETASSQRDWEKHKRAGLGFSTDDNGVSVFVGGERQQEKNRLAQQTAAASQISAGQDLDLTAGRDINQVGSDLKAANDVNLQAGRDIRIDAAREREVMEHVEVYEREGLGVTVNHNFGSTKDAASNTGKGEDSVSKGSSVLKSLDSVSQFFAGPTADVKLGHSKESYSQEISSTTQRASTLSAGNDLNLSASNDVVVKGSVLEAKRDINVKGRDITLDVAKGDYTEEAQQSQSWAGIHGGTTGGIKAGIGGSHGRADQELRQGTSTVTELNAGRDINLQASNDLTLVGTLAQALRDLQLDAGNDLSIRSAQNSSDSESTRRSGGGEVGLTFGSEGVGVYFSGNLGKGNLDREGVTQQEAYLYAGNRLGFTSGRDTTIEGAQLRGDGVVGRVGRNLRVASAVDSGEVKGKEFDLDATVTIGPGSGISGSVGYGKTTGKTHWVGQQTSITAADRLDIRTEQHTQLDGALIASDTGNLKLDTGTLGFSDIRGEDKEHGYYLNVGGSYGLGGGGTQQDRSQVGKGQEGESGWSVEGYDYRKEREQIVRATVGEGEIVVRSDAETGSDSTAGLNRDVSRAYEITKDEESRTDLYVTKSSLEAVGNPKETLQKWKDGAENYGRNSVLAFTNMGVLKEQALSAAEHDKLVAALAWAPVLLVDAMDAMGTPTLGIFPGVANHGGLITQLPVLVTGDLQPMRVTGTFKTDENGQLVLKDGKPILDLDSLQVDQFVGFNDQEDKIFTNGIMNSMMEALANGLMQSGSGNGGGNFVLAYNPTHGLVGDLIESAFDKSLQGAVRSGTARNLNGLFQQGIDAGPETLHIYGHSQGGLLTWVAIKGLDFSQGKSPEVQLNTIQLSGAPVDAIQFHKDAEAAGFGDEERQRAFQINRPDESVFFSLLPKTDTVSDLPLFLGGNAQYSNDPTARTLGALFTVISLFGEDSPHSNYACVTCELSAPGGVDAQIRDIVIKPTLIDSQGNARRPE